MAQTKRKRQTKHRGNAAGVIESRGRTGRKPTAAEKSGDKEKLAREKEALIDKRDRPPTWRAAFVKAMFFGAVFLLVFSIALNQGGSAIGLFPFVIAFYTVVGYYTDKWMYDRRMRKKLTSGQSKKAASR